MDPLKPGTNYSHKRKQRKLTKCLTDVDGIMDFMISELVLPKIEATSCSSRMIRNTSYPISIFGEKCSGIVSMLCLSEIFGKQAKMPLTVQKPV